MANPDSVGQLTLDSFGYGKIGSATAVTLNATGAGKVTIPLLRGGLTNGGAVGNSGGVILRRISVNGPSGIVNAANISITTSSDGNISNVVVGNVVFTNLTTTGKFQDLDISYTANTVVSGSTAQALFVNVNTASGNSNTVNFSVFGEVVSF